MKKLRWIFLSGIPVLALFSIIGPETTLPAKSTVQAKPEGVAIIMTGAAARISQEAELLEELYKRGMMKNVVFISGVSSGALNAVALNGILSGRMTWNEYKAILFKLKDSDIFVPFKENRLPVNTDPVRKLFKQIAEDKLGFHKIGDLPYMTVISVTDLKEFDLKKKVYRLGSQKINEESDPELNLVDIMMASTSVPIVFPPVRIRNVKTIPDVEYVDGGVGEDFVPYHGLLEFEKFRGKPVEKVYIISKKGDDLSNISEQLKEMAPEKNEIRLDKFGLTFDGLLRKKMVKGLESYAKLAPDKINISYVWVPDFDDNFLMFNFNEMEKQYMLTRQWASSHDPVPLGNYLLYKEDNQ